MRFGDHGHVTASNNVDRKTIMDGRNAVLFDRTKIDGSEGEEKKARLPRL